MARAISCFLCLLLVALFSTVVFAEEKDNATAATPVATTAEPAGGAALNPVPAATSDNATALLGILIMKGVLTPAEAKSIQSAGSGSEMQALVDVLTRKGVVSASDLAPATASVAAASPSALSASLATPESQAAAKPTTDSKPPTPPTPAVVPAIAPIRVLPVDPPIKDGLNAAFKMGAVKMTPYGFVKATAVYDSSQPNGDDMPFPGLFLSSTSILNTGATNDPEFHLKARSTRIGANIEWPDVSSKIILTGRIEGDYEGNFSEVDNRDVSSLRSSMFSLRLAFARLDYAASEKTDIYFEGGQDWTLFGSSALPSILETTALGYWYGNIYERSPQFQFGLVQKLAKWHNLKFSPTFAIMMPSTGQIEKLGSLGLQGQIAQAEREGADSGRPELEMRAVFQWQLDPAKGVAPAQFIWSGFDGRRTSIVTSSNSPVGVCTKGETTPCISPALAASYVAAYPNGFTTSSSLYGNQLALQLPTRWATLVASAYFGGDLRFFFGGQVNSFYTDTNGLSNPVMFTTVDGGPLAAAGGATLATNAAGQIVVAPQRPIRAFGGFINLGLPLSRWFNADPKGHNAGWLLYFHMGKDQVVHNELPPLNTGASSAANVLSPLPLLMGKLTAATLYYKLNQWCQFGFEQSIYATRLVPGATYTIAGKPSNEWQDHRTEFGPIFTF